MGRKTFFAKKFFYFKKAGSSFPFLPPRHPDLRSGSERKRAKIFFALFLVL